MWLQRDLSLLGRVLLSKADGISRFVYPTLSLFVQESLCKEINNTLINFVWKNKSHHLKKEILAGPRDDGGVELLDYMDMNYTFKTKWIKEYFKKTIPLVLHTTEYFWTNWRAKFSHFQLFQQQNCALSITFLRIKLLSGTMSS